MNLQKLLTRSVSGLLYIAIIVGCILWGEVGVTLLACVFAALATYEFEKICKDINKETIPALLLDIAGCFSLCLAGNDVAFLLLWLIVMIIRFVTELYIHTPNPLGNLAHSLMTQLYIGLPLCLMSATSWLIGSPKILLLVFIFIWINDTGAFIVGSLLGRHRLFERISPKKSWEGFFGGLAFNIATAILLCEFGYGELSSLLPGDFWIWIGLAMVVTVFGTWGDLVESMIKRELQIKDSGKLIPGHGGILDRIDSLLLVMPAVFVYLLILFMMY